MANDFARSKPSVFLHIGRAKAGSSTVQGLVEDHRPALEAAGYACPLTAAGGANRADLARALSGDGPPDPLEAFSRTLAGPGRVFVSAEAFLSIPAAAIDSLKDRLGARRARILIYVRDYPAWVVSLYAQHTKLGRNVRDFDSFMGVMSGQASIRKPLERWAQAFGDEAIRLRPLTPDSLAGGRLETDLLAALGIDLPVESRIRNAAPPWMALELQRAAAAAVREAGGADLSREGALALIRSFTAATPPDALRVQYLTPSHWRLLADSYDRDMETLGRRFGFATAPSGPPPPERLFLPQASEIPAPVLAAAAASLGRGKVAGRIDPASLGVIRARIGQLAADADRA